MNTRRVLLELFDAAIRAVDGHTCVAAALRALEPGPVELFAIGKAAAAMTRGAYAALGEHIGQALLVTKDGHADPEVSRFANLTLMECAHPVPDERSLAAGAELERRIRALPPDARPVFLISGGSSSLIELPRPGVSLHDLRALNTRGLAAGWDIVRLNAERRRLSRLKGGGVARLLQGRPAHALFISDVPDDDPGVIGSGLLGAEPGREDRVVRNVVANLAMATFQAGEVAKAHGLNLEILAQPFAGDVAEVAR
jgi:hydroxypyruvate reductase